MIAVALVSYYLIPFSLGLLINKRSADELVSKSAHGSLRLLLSTAVNNIKNYPSMGCILLNNVANVEKIFESSCLTWGRSIRRNFAIWATNNVPSIYLDIIFPVTCLKIPEYYDLFSLPSLKANLNSPTMSRHLEEWCFFVDWRVMDELKRADLDLLRAVRRSCYLKTYYSKDHLMALIVEQIPTASNLSISRLILNVDGIKTGIIEELIRPALMRRVCSEREDDDDDGDDDGMAIISIASKKLLGCYNSSEEGSLYDTLAILKFQNLIHQQSSAILMRIIIGAFGIQVALDLFNGIDESLGWDEIDVIDFYELLTDLLKFPLDKRIKILRLYKMNYYDMALLQSPEIWSASISSMLKMPIMWRMRYYRRWGMKLPLIVDNRLGIKELFELYKPKRYLWNDLFTFDQLRGYLRQILANDELFAYRLVNEQIPILRPRLHTAFSDVKRAFEIIWYSVVKFGQPVGVLDAIYCDLFTPVMDEDLLYKLVLEDFKISRRYNKVSPSRNLFRQDQQFVKGIMNDLADQEEAIGEFYLDHKINLIFPALLRRCEAFTAKAILTGNQ